MPLMPKNPANRSDKLPACRKGRFGVKAVDKQVATATRCGELHATAHLRLVATPARIGQFECVRTRSRALTRMNEERMEISMIIMGIAAHPTDAFDAVGGTLVNQET